MHHELARSQVWMFVSIWNKISNLLNQRSVNFFQNFLFLNLIFWIFYLCNYCILLFKHNFKTTANTEELIYKPKI